MIRKRTWIKLVPSGIVAQVIMWVLLSLISKESQQLIDLRHSVGLKLGENELAIEHDLEGTGRPKCTLQHVEAKISTEEDDHFLLLEALVERVLVDCWDESAAYA